MPRVAMSEILAKASKIKNKEDKINFLRANYSRQLHEVLAYGLSPLIEWDLPIDSSPESDPPYKPLTDTDNAPNMLYSEARKLYLFVKSPLTENLKPFKRQQLFVQFLETIDQEDAKMMLQFVRKKNPFKGINAELIDEAFGPLDKRFISEKNQEVAI